MDAKVILFGGSMKDMFVQVKEEIECRSNIETMDGRIKRKKTYYSAKGIDEAEKDE